mmetsp:Transcript_9447/g.29821  ORF Transcript_9447/g.29821 Transcript_9447/m.29821 type:complete len:252 (+) Transcript_9447:262-1017(+)
MAVRPPMSATIWSMRANAAATASSVLAVIVSTPSERERSMFSTPDVSMIEVIVSPPLPMIAPQCAGSNLRLVMRMTVDGSDERGPGCASSILLKMCCRPSCACASAVRSSGTSRPSHLTSSCKAVTPSLSPATLKSIEPSASSRPRMSVSTTCSAAGLSSKRRPIATPATGLAIGTAASISARQPPQTDAIDEEPHDIVMSDSIRTVYGNCAAVGIDGASARSARFPWPTSRLPGAPPKRPTSPTEKGGNE